MLRGNGISWVSLFGCFVITAPDKILFSRNAEKRKYELGVSSVANFISAYEASQ